MYGLHYISMTHMIHITFLLDRAVLAEGFPNLPGPLNHVRETAGLHSLEILT